MIFNAPGLVRACRLCFEQALERSEQEAKHLRRRMLEKSSTGQEVYPNNYHHQNIFEKTSDKYNNNNINKHSENLQQR
jgi:hypothetical protein